MVKKYLIFLWLLVSISILGNIVSCASDSNSRNNSNSGDLRISTQNLYLGADLNPIVLRAGEAASAGEAAIQLATGRVNTAIGTALRIILANDFGARAVAIARIIANERPHVIGLQEVSTYVLADGTTLNFLTILQNVLRDEELSYKVAANAEGADIMVPVSDGQGGTASVRYSNSDVILVESSLNVVGDAYIKGYGVNLPPIALGANEISFPRSFARVTLQGAGFSPFVVAHTHLEANPGIDAIQTVQTAQAGEFIADLVTITDTPVFVIGDLNSFAPGTGDVGEGSTSVSYEAFIAAGYTDSYLEANPGVETTANSTCCYDEDLRITDSSIGAEGRIDHILYRGDGITTSAVQFTGNKVEDQATTAEPRKVWPSDHLGVVGTFSGDL